MGRGRHAGEPDEDGGDLRVHATLDSVLRDYGPPGSGDDAPKPWRRGTERGDVSAREVEPAPESIADRVTDWPLDPEPGHRARRSRPVMIVALAALLGAAGLLITLLSGGGSPTAPVRPVAKAQRVTTLPLKVLWNVFGARPTITVRVGNGPRVPVLLDTGSTGLHIYSDGVRLGPRSGVTLTAHPDSATYFDGTVQRGLIGRARITIGRVTTATAVPFGLVNFVGCVHELPCPGAEGIHGRIARGEYGILGIGLRRSADKLGNPLLALPRADGRTWSVALHGSRGSLTMGAPDPLHPLARFPLARDGRDPSGRRAWKDDKARVCWATVWLRGAGCEPTVFDTGSETMFWYGGLMSHATTYPGSILVEPGTYIAAWQPGSSQGFWSFTAGTDFSRDTVLALNLGRPGVIADVQAFLTFRITYDANRGEIFVSRKG